MSLFKVLASYVKTSSPDNATSLERLLVLALFDSLYLLSPRIFFFIAFNRDLFVNRDDSLTS